LAKVEAAEDHKTAELDVMSTNGTLDVQTLWAEQLLDKLSIPSTGRKCIDGKHLPDLYVLGAQKSATSSFAGVLKHGGIHASGPSYKEWHFFDSWAEHANWADPEMLEPKKKEWLAQLSLCPAHPEKRCTVNRDGLVFCPAKADYTPSNLRLVPYPDYATPDFSTRCLNFNLPVVLKSLYGPEFADGIQFVVLLREPLARMQSAWYSLWKCKKSRSEFLFDTQGCGGSDFQSDVLSAIEKFNSTEKKVTELLWGSMYNTHIKAYRRVFQARQFMIIPMQMYVNHHDVLVATLRRRMKIGLPLTPRVEPHGHVLHPPVETDVREDVRTRFDELMSQEIQGLVATLASMGREHAVLAGYDRRTHKRKRIKEWLYALW